MKLRTICFGVVGVMFSAFCASASIFYVNVGNPAPASPFASWATAATNIQDAIDAAGAGDTVFVTNGIYAYGGRVMAGDLTNRVALTNAITVQSINGPFVTTITGVGATNGNTAVRCAWLTNGASLTGFTLMRGATRSTGDSVTLRSGGGVWCASSNALVSNCMIVSNAAATQGGGIYQGSIRNCFISSNACPGGSSITFGAVLNNCTIISNANTGVVSPMAMTNCIIYYNFPGNFVATPAGSHCCSVPMVTGPANFTTAPQLFADGIHLMSGSPCIGAGTNTATGLDIFGNTWSNPPAVGCAEWTAAPVVVKLQYKLTSAPIGYTIGNGTFNGLTPFNCFWLKDGVPLQDNGHYSSTQSSNLVATGVSPADAGNYQLVVSNAFGVVTSAVAPVVIHCVDAAGTNPIAPYLTWATAATNIQDAITASAIGEIVLVTNGLYASGGKVMEGSLTNRVSMDKAILLQSVNGAVNTIIQGALDPITTNGSSAVRCVWMTNSAILNGFTLRNGATLTALTSPQTTTYGGGVFSTTNSIVWNCIITTNFASYYGGGAYGVTLVNCTLANNQSVGTGSPGSGVGGYGGGAENCNLTNCLVTGNFAYPNYGGGADNCILINCALTKNTSAQRGAAANAGTLVNCTATGNLAPTPTSGGNGAGVYGATLKNCIVFGNPLNGANTYNNYLSCTFTYSCAHPLPAGTGNIDVDPLMLGDGFHLAATSPCLGAGDASVVSGTDIDGQAWNNPPPMGCDEWQPAPVISVPLTYQINSPVHGLTFTAVVAGQSPFNYFWSKDGVPVQDDGHYSNSGTANLVVNNFGPADTGAYQVVATNSFGAVTSQVARVVIHAVDAAGANPIPPYITWATAATNIQDAINASSAGDIVLVTNGVYATGGKVMVGDLTNRVALDRAVTVISASGYASTIIQGAWDPTSTNGPGAIRCAYVGDGAVLTGFTLQNGATRATGDPGTGGPLESGGGVWCGSANGIVANCVLSNNSAIFGGGIAYGTLNNSLVLNNFASLFGGGAYYATLNNCTVENNFGTQGSSKGAGTYDGAVRNSIVVGNYINWPFFFATLDNHSAASLPAKYSYSCTSPTTQLSGTGNITATVKFLDYFHIAQTSPCRGAGSPLYATGTDLDGELWAGPPSMGCDEVIVSNLTGSLSVNVSTFTTNLIVNKAAGFFGNIYGRAAGAAWSFGDGTVITNTGSTAAHQWTNTGNFTVTFTAYNNENPDGISGSTVVNVDNLKAVQLQSAVLLTNGFQFQFTSQVYAAYSFQYATNLTPPITWWNLPISYSSTSSIIQIMDSAPTNQSRFYRVGAQ